ncbi:unnamed protein product [Acanthoscelides obtectus]|uniref:G-protein coupled receptors family 1 profile domain-containing protein n=1 Tax=Acanthoscelides obtectus TaxID=200917 RepID=A0A9P0PAJ6_ACAOB|nr:unnamed protein product [Acanthoscelides obtectus]CAK1631417.1 Cardioacceleratory peptide receptor [Acanthoscelides obtectus]
MALVFRLISQRRVFVKVSSQLQCWLEFSSQWMWRLYMTLVCISLFALPTAIIATCYAIIITTIWTKSTETSFLDKGHRGKRSGRREKENASDNSRRASSRGLIPRAKVKTVKITLVIVSVFVICWSPYMVFDLLQVYGQVPPTQTNIAIATFVQSLAPLNSAANPLIYAIFSAHCGRILWLLPPFKWICKKRKKRPKDSTTNTQSSTMSEFLTHTHKRKSEMSNSVVNTVLIHAKK